MDEETIKQLAECRNQQYIYCETEGSTRWVLFKESPCTLSILAASLSDDTWQQFNDDLLVVKDKDDNIIVDPEVPMDWLILQPLFITKHESSMKTQEELFSKPVGSVKFVNVHGEYRFCDQYADHAGLLTAEEFVDESISAGWVEYDTEADGTRFMSIPDRESYTLGYVGPTPQDGPTLAKLLNKKLVVK